MLDGSAGASTVRSTPPRRQCRRRRRQCCRRCQSVGDERESRQAQQPSRRGAQNGTWPRMRSRPTSHRRRVRAAVKFLRRPQNHDGSAIPSAAAGSAAAAASTDEPPPRRPAPFFSPLLSPRLCPRSARSRPLQAQSVGLACCLPPCFSVDRLLDVCRADCWP